MKERKRYTPYIRRAKSGDKTASLRTAGQMALLADRKHYVLVQRGCSGVLASGRTKLDIVRQLAGARTAAMRRPDGDWHNPTMRDFRAWSRSVKKLVNGRNI